MRIAILSAVIAGAVLLSAVTLSGADAFPERQPTFAPDPAAGPWRRALVTAKADSLAQALDVPANTLVSATIGESDPRGVALCEGALGHHLPTRGGSFVILSTGLAASADTPNAESGLSNVLDGLDNVQFIYDYPYENDMTQLTLTLRPPAAARCLGFDFAYYSEEYPEFVGSVYNDTFLAELGASDFVINADYSVNAPSNFAYDTQNNIISINTVFGMTEDSATTYDGGTALLKAVSPIPAGTAEIDVVFTVQDIGDSIYDSAVFLDNFYWSTDATCSAGALQDTDGDGLLDDWEANGLDVDGDGVVDVDLPAMGADPFHKDIFVEVDYMVETICSSGAGIGACYQRSHQPRLAAIEKVTAAFAAAPVSNPDGTAGIRLHVDAGPDFPMNPATGATWGALSGATALYHKDHLGADTATGWDWAGFNAIRAAHLADARRNVFRYCVFGHELSPGLEGVSGASQGVPGSGFVVTLGSWTDGAGTVNEQAGAFMHGLGNNLGLRSGGGDDVGYKPNSLSVMNPLFQSRGLRIDGEDGHFDYSRFAMADLDENQLSETVAMDAMAGATAAYGTRFFSADGAVAAVDDVTAPIDYNGDGALDPSVSVDLNNDGELTVLSGGIDEWRALVYKGGEVGSLGIIYEPPGETDPPNLSRETDALIPSPYAVAAFGPPVVTLEPGDAGTYLLTVKNIGENGDTYALTAQITQGWADISAVPATLALASGESRILEIPVAAPAGAAYGQMETLAVGFASQANANLAERVYIVLKAVEPGDANSDATLDAADVATLADFILGLGAAVGNPDTNADQAVNVLDIIALINRILGA